MINKKISRIYRTKLTVGKELESFVRTAGLREAEEEEEEEEREELLRNC